MECPSRGCGSLQGSGFALLEVFRRRYKGLLVGLRHGRWDLRRAKTSQRILDWLGITNWQLPHWHRLVTSVVATCTHL